MICPFRTAFIAHLQNILWGSSSVHMTNNQRLTQPVTKTARAPEVLHDPSPFLLLLFSLHHCCHTFLVGTLMHIHTPSLYVSFNSSFKRLFSLKLSCAELYGCESLPQENNTHAVAIYLFISRAMMVEIEAVFIVRNRSTQWGVWCCQILSRLS